MNHEPIYFAPQRKLGGGWLLFKSSPSPPPAPDYAGAANATAAGNIDASRIGTKANRINQNTPYGSLTYSQDPNDQDKWSSDISLTPTGRQLLDYSNNSALGLGAETGQALDRVDQSLSQPFNFGSVKDVSDTSYAAQTARLDPQWQTSEAQHDTQLRNQGVMPGSEAYTNAMRTFNNAKNDAYSQARLNAIGTQPQTYQLANALRTQPLNELNALRTGSQVTNPTFNSNVPQQGTTTGANLANAASQQGVFDQGIYNAGVGATNSANAGMYSLGGTALTAAMLMSDRRLKRNIHRIGTHRLGIGVYEFRYLDDDSKHIGVMADEVRKVMPQAVITVDGFDVVNYSMIG